MEQIKLICFDLDDTIITYNSWKQLNLSLGITKEVDRFLYNEYIAGRLTNDEWNLKLLELYIEHPDATREGITNILSKYTLVHYAKEIVTYLQNKKYEIVLISGSMGILVSHVAHTLGIKYFKANNTLVFDDEGRLQSIHSGGYDHHAKLRYLKAFAEMLHIPITECACIGDGANDIEMFKVIMRGVTFSNAKIINDAWKVINTLEDLKIIF